MTEVRLWHDDVRLPPEGWAWARTNDAAIEILENENVVECSLDHDLGLDYLTPEQIQADPTLMAMKGRGEQTGYHLVCWMIEMEKVPAKVTIHSWNIEKARWMAARLNYFGYDCFLSPFKATAGGPPSLFSERRTP